MMNVISRACAAVLVTFGLSLSTVQAGQLADSDGLQTKATVYLWLPTMEGDLKYGPADGGATIGAGAILDALEMAFMGGLEFRKNEWSLLTDVIYLDLQDSKTNPVALPGGGDFQTEIDLELKGWQLGLYGGYRLYRTERASLDLLAGARYLSLDTDARLGASGPLPDRSLDRSASIWDGVIGFRGVVDLGNHWFAPYHADIGTGDSEVTWQAMVGVGYDLGWGDVTMVYRHLEWDQGDNELIQGLSFSGPAFAVDYRF
jgi:hypothetical protein